MDFFTGLFQNRIFLASALGWLVAQILKTLIHLLFTKKFVAERLVGSGGMPSSHSATVCALVTATYMEHGSSGSPFALSLILAIIVMYDAIGVRRETGIQAQLLNNMIKIFEDMGREELSAQDKLKEFIGHTPFQVLIGGILGVFIAVAYYRLAG
ncbi:MAG: divergent PAP2 family protein [bacterium]|nr:divergent PAP2 family protein [bacterium]MCM1374831.1 divergent PAP2 family protein [Muribaculum sp.]